MHPTPIHNISGVSARLQFAAFNFHMGVVHLYLHRCCMIISASAFEALKEDALCVTIYVRDISS